MLLENVTFKYGFDLKPLDKNGETSALLDHNTLELDPDNVHYQFDNLFNGDKTLGDNFNVFINENWFDIYNEVGPSFTKGLGLVLKNLLNNILEKFTFAELFD